MPKTKKIKKFYYGRHNNPLNYQNKNGIITIASEGPGIELETDVIYEKNPYTKSKPKEYSLIVKEPPTINTSSRVITIGQELKNDKKENNQNPLWTEDDEKEMQEYNNIDQELDLLNEYDFETGMPKTIEGYLEEQTSEIMSEVETFIYDLQDEDIIYKTNILDSLTEIKGMMKRTKGTMIAYYRKKNQIKEKEKNENLEAMGFQIPKKVDILKNNLPFI